MHVQGGAIAIVEQTATANGHDGPLLGLLFGGVRNHDAALCHFFFRGWFHDHTVGNGTNLSHDTQLLCTYSLFNRGSPSGSARRAASTSPLLRVVDHAHDRDRAIERIITVAGAARGAPGAAVDLALHNCRRPEKFDVAVCAAMLLASSRPTLHVLRAVRLAVAHKALLPSRGALRLSPLLHLLLIHSSGLPAMPSSNV